jgi:hypothetical protein
LWPRPVPLASQAPRSVRKETMPLFFELRTNRSAKLHETAEFPFPV